MFSGHILERQGMRACGIDKKRALYGGGGTECVILTERRHLVSWITTSSLIYNLGNNTLELLNILAKFPFTTSKVALDIYNSKQIFQVASRVAKQLKTKVLGN